MEQPQPYAPPLSTLVKKIESVCQRFAYTPWGLEAFSQSMRTLAEWVCIQWYVQQEEGKENTGGNSSNTPYLWFRLLAWALSKSLQGIID